MTEKYSDIEKEELGKKKQPTWVQKLDEGVPQEDAAHHRHLLKKLTPIIKDLFEFANNTRVFDPEDAKKLSEVAWILKKYEYPFALVRVKKEAPPLFLP